jgi:cytochrome c553
MTHFAIVLMIATLLIAGCAPNVETVIPYADIPAAGDAERGAQLFNQSINTAPACSSCHLEEPDGASPVLAGYSQIAGERVEGEDAREYTFYSIAEPARYVVEGFGNVMYDQYDEKLTPQQIADLMAYLLTL